MTITSLAPQHSLQTLATTVNRGALGDQSVHPAPTDKSAQLLAGREDKPQGGGLLSSLGAKLAAPFIALRDWVSQLLNPGKSDTAAQTSRQGEKSNQPTAELLKQQAQMGLELSVGGLAKALALADVTADNLVEVHAALASGAGALRSLATGLRALEKAKVQPYASEAKSISSQIIGGLPLSQWGTIGAEASAWLEDATQPELAKAAQQIRQLVPQIKQLLLAINRELKGEQPLMRMSDVDWSVFTREMSADETHDKLKEITHNLMTYRSADDNETSSSVEPTGITDGFKNIPVIKDTLIDVPTFKGKYTHYNANYVQGGTAIAAQAPKKGENTALFANLLVQEKPALIVNLTQDKDGTVDYFSPGQKTFRDNATFEGQSSGEFFTQLDVQATTGETHSLAFARVPIKDFNAIDISELRDAVVNVSDWMDEHSGEGALLVHCRAGVGRTGMFLLALETYRLFKSGDLSLENYAEKVLSGATALRIERGPDTVQTSVQLQTNLDYAAALVTVGSQAEVDDVLYENSAFLQQMEDLPEYMNTGDLEMARNIRSASPQPEALYANSDELRALASANKNDVGQFERKRPLVAPKPTFR